MRKPFQVGDRVRAYVAANSYWDGTITKVIPPAGVFVRTDSGMEFGAHIKRLRRLRKKEKPTVVEFEDMPGRQSVTELGYVAHSKLIPLIGKRVRVRVEEVK